MYIKPGQCYCQDPQKWPQVVRQDGVVKILESCTVKDETAVEEDLEFLRNEWKIWEWTQISYSITIKIRFLSLTILVTRGARSCRHCLVRVIGMGSRVQLFVGDPELCLSSCIFLHDYTIQNCAPDKRRGKARFRRARLKPGKHQRFQFQCMPLG